MAQELSKLRERGGFRRPLRGGISLQETGFGELGEAVEPKGRRPPCLRTPKNTIHANQNSESPTHTSNRSKIHACSSIMCRINNDRMRSNHLLDKHVRLPLSLRPLLLPPSLLPRQETLLCPRAGQALVLCSTPQLPSSFRSLLQAGTQVSQEPASVADPAPREAVASAFRSSAA